MRWTWIIAGLLVIAGLLYVSYDTAYIWAARWQLQRRAVTYSSLRLEDGILIVEEPVVEGLLHAERLEVRSPRDIAIIRPHIIKEGRGGGGIEELRKVAQSKRCIAVRGGILETADAIYQVEAELGHAKEAELTLAKEGETLVSVALRGEVLRCAFHEMPTSVLRLLRPDLQVLEEGTVSGRVIMRMPTKKLSGQLKLRNIHIGVRDMEVGCEEGLLTLGATHRLEIRKGGRIEAPASWAAEDLHGEFKLEDRWLSMNVKGEITHAQESFPLEMRGEVPIDHIAAGRLHLAWPGEDPRPFAEVRGYELPSGATSLSIWLSNLRERQTRLMRLLALEIFPALPEIQGGNLSGRVRARFQEGRLQELRLSDFVGEHLAFAEAQVAKIEGDLRLRVTPELHFTDASGTFSVEGGALAGRLTDLCAQGLLGSGCLQRCEVSGSFDGRAGRLQLTRPDNRTHIELTADDLAVSAQLEDDCFHVEGRALDVDFGVQLRLGDAPSEPWMPLVLSLVDNDRRRAASSFAIEEGWLTGQDVDLAILPGLSGHAAVRGHFDGKGIDVSYAGRNLQFENEEMCVEIPEIAGATHHYDFATGAQSGKIPLRGGRYLEKHLDLQFENVSADVTLAEGVNVENLLAEWRDLYFEGAIQMGDRIELRASKAAGSASSVRDFLRRTCDVACWDWEIDGDAIGQVALDIQGAEVTGSVSVQLENATWGPLREAKVEIDYDQDAHNLQVRGLHGATYLGDERWDLEGENFSFDVLDPKFAFDITAKRDQSVIVGHLQSDDQLTLTAEGHDVTVQGKSFGSLELAGWQREEKWMLEHVRGEGFVATAHGMGVQIEDARLDWGDTLSLIFQGAFSDGGIDGEVTALSLNLAGLGHRGYLQGAGTLRADPEGLSGEFQLRGQSLFFHGIQLCNRLPFEVSLADRAMSIGGLHGWLIREGHPIRVQAESVNLSVDGWGCNDLAFSIPEQEMEWICAKLSELSELPPAFWDLLSDPGDLVGRISLQQRESLTFDAYLRELQGQPNLNNIHCHYGDGVMEVEALTPFRDRNLKLQAHWAGADPDQLHLKIEDGLMLDYLLDPVDGAELQKLSGKIPGIALDLQRSDRGGAEILALDGSVVLNFPEAQQWLPHDFHSVLEKGGLGDSFTFAGSFAFPKREISQLAFRGSVHADESLFLGRRWHHLEGQLTVAPGRCDLQGVTLSDRGGCVEMESFTARRDKQGEWHLAVPTLSVSELRPSLLRRSDNSVGAPSDLRVTTAQMYDIKGISSQPTSWSGRGTIDFSNLPERDYSGTILAIPEELLSKLGLNPGNLVPAKGRIQCRLRGDKLVITRLDNVYSRGQHSQFLLANRSGESTVGLDGTLDIKIRMRQYNLLLKPAELFRYTIRGTLSSPKIGVQPKKAKRRWG